MKLSLYHSPYCPFCTKVVSALKTMSMNVDLRDTGDKEHFLALKKGGGKTQVPCLKIENNGKVRWMYESSDIVQFLKSL